MLRTLKIQNKVKTEYILLNLIILWYFISGNNLNYTLWTEVSFQWTVEAMRSEELKIPSWSF